MKDRLIELLGKADEATEILIGDFPSYEEELKAFYTGIANYLLDNGVIVLPCAVGDTVWEVVSLPMLPEDGFKEEYMIWERLFRYEDIEDIGKYVFLTKEEAEAKLKELEELKGIEPCVNFVKK